jgi:single-strand DNA-binding protein
MYLNKVSLYGNLTRDPELKALPSGQNVVNFSLATNRVFKDKEGRKQEATEYHNVVAFGRTADLINQYMKKGRPLYVEGRLQTRSWDKDGAKQYRTEVIAETFQFGPSAGATGGSGGSYGGGEEESYGGGSSAPAASSFGSSAPAPMPSGDEIQYPEEEINPEDIPF